MNLEESVKLIAVLKAAYPNAPVTQETPLAYQRGLGDLDYETVSAAAALAMRASKFLPTIAELRTIIAEAMVNLPPWEEAWRQIVEARREYGIYAPPDNPLMAAWPEEVRQALRVVGGYETVCWVERDQERTLMAHFRDAYTRIRERAVREAQYGDVRLPQPGAAALAADVKKEWWEDDDAAPPSKHVEEADDDPWKE